MRVSCGSSSGMFTPSISASRTSLPSVIRRNAFSAASSRPPFRYRKPDQAELTTGFTAPRAWMAGAGNGEIVPVFETTAPTASVAEACLRKSRRSIGSCAMFRSGFDFALRFALCAPSVPIMHPLNANWKAAGTIPSGTDIGHVHLKVSSIDKALDFYCGVLGFELMTTLGDSAAFVSAGGYHHHIGLNTWHSRGGGPPPPRAAGLYHVATRVPAPRAP